MLPGPRLAYNPYKNRGKVVRRSDMILKLLHKRGVLTDEEYQAAMAADLNIAGLQKKVDQSVSTPPVFASPSSSQSQTGEKPVEEESDISAEPAKTAPEDNPTEQLPAKQPPPPDPLPEKQ
jgi:monofunctional biosynthetic peptidoglycan transglycosylase